MQIRYRTELPELMRQLGLPMVAAEIGVAQGLHSADLLRNGIEHLLMVDNWKTIAGQKGDGGSPQGWHNENFLAAEQVWLKNKDRAKMHIGLSHQVAWSYKDEYFGLVYLDADHSYEGVMKDLNAWFPKLVPGGIMAMHDFLAPEYGVKKAVEDFVNTMGDKVSKVYLLLENKREDAGGYFFKQ